MHMLKPKALTLAMAAATGLMAGLPAQAYESPVHIFSIEDVMGGFNGSTYGPAGAIQDGTILCIPGVTADTCPVSAIVDKEGVTLYPIDSEFGFEVVDFLGARAKVRNNDYQEGFAGNIEDGGTVIGVKISNAATDTYKVKPPLGTWCQGLGGNSVKCSTEHYTVLEHVVSCHEVVPYSFADPFTGAQKEIGYPGEAPAVSCADQELDNEVRVITDGILGDIYSPGAIQPNDNTSVVDDIATSSDYSITLKDDGKVLYRWGSLIKRPNDVRLYARLPLPEEWKVEGADFPVTRAELHVTHWITNNPNDQLRPEDLENEGATGRTPDYRIAEEGGDEYWLSTRACFEGDGDFITGEGDVAPTPLPAGTVFKNGRFVYPNLAADPATQPQPLSADLTDGFSNGFYTTINRDPFEWSYRILDGNDDGSLDAADDALFNHVGFPFPLTEAEATASGLELVSGPRWRLKANKFGQDIPGLEIPFEECSEPPFANSNIKYEVGELVTTVVNLLDWEEDNPEGPSPLRTSIGWVDATANALVTITTPEGEAPVTSNGLPLTDDFDLAVYVKGDRKPTAILDAKLVIEYEGEALGSELYNLSTRAEVGEGANIVIGGFMISGTEQQCVVIRGRGPSMAVDATRLADPNLTIFESGNGTPLDSNDNWGDDQTSAEMLETLNLAPGSELDAALYTCLDPGAYTAQLSGIAETELGLGIFEVFDVDDGTSRLTNISTRAEVGNGEQVLITGFIIEGDGPRDILIRARGPSVNIEEATITNPALTLFEGGDVLVVNNDWVDAPNEQAIIDSGFAPTFDEESAILITLEPGTYSVHTSSVTGELGIGIVEVFDLTEE